MRLGESLIKPSRGGFLTRDAVGLEKNEREDKVFILENELSGERLDRFKQAMANNLEKIQQGGGNFETYYRLIARLMLVQLLTPEAQTEFKEIKKGAWPAVLDMLKVDKPSGDRTTREWIVTRLILAYPEEREMILKAGEPLEKKEFNREIDIDDTLYEVCELALQRMVTFGEDIKSIHQELDPYYEKIKENLKSDDWELTAVPEIAILACIFPEKKEELTKIALELLKKNPPRKWDSHETPEAYLNYLFFLTLATAHSITVSGEGRLLLGKRPKAMKGEKPLPQREIV